MKMKQGKWRRLIFCMALMCIAAIMPATPSKAAEENTITLTPVAYNIGEETLKFRLSTNATDLTLAYYIGSWSEGYTDEERFELATKTDVTEVEFYIPEGFGIWAWLIDENGEDSLRYDFYTNIWNSHFLLDDVNSEIIFENGETLDSYDPKITFDQGRLSVEKPNECHTYACIYFQNEKLQTHSVVNDDNFVDLGGMITNINESGTYEYRIVVYNKEVCSRVHVVSYEYVKPEQKIAAVDPDSIKIKNGVVTHQAGIEGALGYEYRLYSSDDGVNFERDWRKGSSYEGRPDTGIYSGFSDNFGEGKVYKVGIRTYSNDIETLAHSDEVFSPIYDPSGESEDIENILGDILAQAGVDSVEKADADTLTNIYEQASDEEKAKISKALKDGLCSLDKNQLRFAMQTSAATRDTVKAIEAMAGVTVKTDNISEEAKEFIEAGSVQMVGAGLNAADGVSEVGLEITKADTGTIDESLYKKAIPLGITLNGVKDAGDLAVPVQITMPVPKGIAMNKIVILHMNPDGTVNEKLTNGDGVFYNFENRTITFTVTHFSTFIFAEENSEDGNTDNSGNGDTNKPEDGNTDNPGNGDANKPEDGNTDNPGNGDTNKPEDGNTDNPGNEETNTPENDSAGSSTDETANKTNAVDTAQSTSGENTDTVNVDNTNTDNGNGVSPKTSDDGAGVLPIAEVLAVCAAALAIYVKRRKIIQK